MEFPGLRAPCNTDRGVMHMRGRFWLPFGGAGGKRASGKMRTILAVTAGVLVVTLFILSLWLGAPDYTYRKLPHFETLYDMMGRSATDVAPFVGVSPGELVGMTDGTYKLPQGEVYAGIAFETTLYFEDEMLSGFAYTAVAPAEAKDAAKDIANVAEMFSVERLPLDDGTEVELSKKALRQYFEDSEQPFAVQHISDCTPSEQVYQDAVTKYLRMLENDPNWEGRVGEYLTKQACFYGQIDMGYNVDTQTVSVQLQFFVDAEQE